jgi:hypothetical protein
MVLGGVVIRADRTLGVGGFAPFRNVPVLLATGALGLICVSKVLLDGAVLAADGNALSEA